MSATTLMFDFNRLPEQWRAFTQQALAAWKADMFSVRRPLSGKSGAVVMLVDIRTSIFEGQAILKLSNGGLLAKEELQQEQARQISPSIAGRIPSTPHQHVDGSRSAMLMTVAGHGLLETEVLANAKGTRLNLAVQMISESLLTEFNPAPSSSLPLVSAGALLAGWLEHRLGPDSRIPEMMKRLLSLPDSCDSFRYGGINYPNPYGFARTDFTGNRIELLPALGNMHGDLHSENILVGGQLALWYYYIDFAFLRMNTGLLFDHCYLELHLLFVHRETTTYGRWSRLCQSLNGLDDTQAVVRNLLDQEDHGILWTIGMLRAAIHRWIRSCFPERSEDLRKQLLLARIAAGLNFANKMELADDHVLSSKKKVFAFLYAATAARELFDYCRTPVRDDGLLARLEQDIPSPIGTAWRAVWRECGSFNDREATYILIAGPDLCLVPEDIQSQFGRLPWSLVIDFDSDVSHKFGTNAGGSLRRQRGVHPNYPHQSVNLDFAAATCWFFAEPGPADTFSQWRKQTLPGLRAIADALMRATVPRPAYLVVLGGRMDLKKLEYTVTTLEDQFAGALRIVVVSNDADDPAYQTVVQGSQGAQDLACSWRNLGLGIHEMLGDLAEQPGVWIPFRDPASKAVSRIQIDVADLALFSETVEIVPAGPVSFPQGDAEPEAADFLHGNIITWRELDLHLDVDREVTRGPNGALQRLRALLAAVPAESFAIDHTPGAGGTTISRRIAWELRDEYPCLVLKTLSNTTYDVIERLSQKSNLPILLVAETAKLPGNQRELLFNALKRRGLRFVILDVRRCRDPRDTNTSLAVVDPMSFGDTQRFLQQYERKAPESRRQALRDLADRPDFAPYRSPFFFGFYAFECNFVRVPEFVQSLLVDLPQEARRVLAQLALIRRYSQEKLPAAALRSLLGLPPAGTDGWAVDPLLDGPLKRIVMFDGRNVSVLHPLLAEEIIRQYLQPSDSLAVEAWRVNLGDFCIGFIQQMADETLRASTAVVEILTDICIERGARQDSLTAQTFSDLLNDLRSVQAQRRVLEALCEHFPDNGHFWSHLGRHISIQDSGSFEEAEAKLRIAINLGSGPIKVLARREVA